MNRFFVIISGPTGVGKTEFVDKLADAVAMPVCLINGDMGQMYHPLSIGTAKPDMTQQKHEHYLFDFLQEPRDYTVLEYRALLVEQLERCWREHKLPIIVGGSGFYLKSLVFPPRIANPSKTDTENNVLAELDNSWQLLHKVDPSRAAAIHPHDTYRIARALAVWRTGALPSEQKPVFMPPGQFSMIFLNRERQDLYERINKRTAEMVENGWITEVKNLTENWRTFLKQKKIIGYPEIIDFLEKEGKLQEQVIEEIRGKTRAYAKRQGTFWRSFCKQLLAADPHKHVIRSIEEINLTLSEPELYINKLSHDINHFIAVSL
jgi:tRNA dimethylallyltransferase